jgi:hypothetical protein
MLSACARDRLPLAGTDLLVQTEGQKHET